MVCSQESPRTCKKFEDLTWTLLVGDGLAFLMHGVLEHMLSTLDRGPLQTDVQQVVSGADILGQYELRVGIQFLKQSRYLLRIQSCWNTWWDCNIKKRLKRAHLLHLDSKLVRASRGDHRAAEKPFTGFLAHEAASLRASPTHQESSIPAIPRGPSPGPSPPPGLRDAAEPLEAPGQSLGREEGHLTRSVHGAQAARRGNGSFGVLRPAPGRHSASQAGRSDQLLAPGAPERGNRLGGGGGREKRGPWRDKTPPTRCWVSAVGAGPAQGRAEGAGCWRAPSCPNHPRAPGGSGPRGPLWLRFPTPGAPS